MQFLYSALFSNELKALYILLPPAHLYKQTPVYVICVMVYKCMYAFS